MPKFCDEYSCIICGSKNVKLWWPKRTGIPFLICASCAEENRAIHEPEWKVDEDGRIPLYRKGKPVGKTRVLNVNLSKYFTLATKVEVVPAVYTNNTPEVLDDVLISKAKWDRLPIK